MDQVSVTLLGTAVIVALGALFSSSRVGAMNIRLSGANSRIDALQQNITSVIHPESARLQAGLDRMERTLNSHLSRIEAKLGIR